MLRPVSRALKTMDNGYVRKVHMRTVNLWNNIYLIDYDILPTSRERQAPT